MILTKVQEDPLSASCLNISYGDVQGLVANPNPTGSPFASMNPNAVGTNGVIDQRSPNKVPNSTILPNTPFSLNLGNGRSLDLRFNSVPGWPTADPSLMNQFLQQMTSTLRALGFTENTIEEIIRYSFRNLRQSCTVWKLRKFTFTLFWQKLFPRNDIKIMKFPHCVFI